MTKKKATKHVPAKRSERVGILETRSGVKHPGVLWLEAMQKKGTSQAQVAAKMGVATMTLNRLVNGHGIPTARITLAYARAMNASVARTWQQVCDFELALALEAESDEKSES